MSAPFEEYPVPQAPRITAAGKPLLKKAAIAERLNCSPRTVERLWAAGKLGYVTVLSTRMVSDEQLDQFIADNSTNAAS